MRTRTISPRVTALSMVCSTVTVRHNVRDDQYLQAQENRPADILPEALVGRRGASAEDDCRPDEGKNRTDDQDRDPGDLEAVDYAFHGLVQTHVATLGAVASWRCPAVTDQAISDRR